MFRFKQFSVDQTGCAMKINTDGVLLGAMAGEGTPSNILDIGTGTGVIAMMLAQRFTNPEIDAVEIDEQAATTANGNFSNSPFNNKLTLYAKGFEPFFEDHPDKRYDLIVSNPPFYINSLQSPGAKVNLAKHAADGFFEKLIATIAAKLTEQGTGWLILPVDTAELVKDLVKQNGLYLKKIITVHSFKYDAAHREILAFGRSNEPLTADKFIIYNEPKVYTEMYRELLKDFLIIF
ncbi:tRNA1Val (adenine37-N6)-methyltransferase [Mucilaginibacter gossypiicola]|uniref:tRNA1(Val) (adenine(37)-N6)-methyltransferase n=1 Tax=Mucilaginibacter gossypiicola TaxID=551995 RepID=A0A1H8NPU8_9SPHI|nr:methyltransferase [Mucilaginibacter gossypiicola]SEO31711.1 tRNA1Val (adenine37-N6)-methyltransferase [Mucilaginibacter gossypiicola]